MDTCTSRPGFCWALCILGTPLLIDAHSSEIAEVSAGHHLAIDCFRVRREDLHPHGTIIRTWLKAVYDRPGATIGHLNEDEVIDPAIRETWVKAFWVIFDLIAPPSALDIS
jgi:hypothetical protein